MTRKTKKIIFHSFLFLSLSGWVKNSYAQCTGSGLAYSCPTGTTVAQVNAAISSASDGATITFDPGSYTWDTPISPVNGKAVTLIGAGTAGGGSNVNIQGGTITLEGVTVDKKYRISGFTFSGVPGGTAAIWIYPSLGYTLTDLRVDHNTFSSMDPGGSNSSIAILVGCTEPYGGATTGVIDHNTFTGADNFMAVKALGIGSSVAAPPSPKGTANNLFFEDNTLNFTTMSNASNGCVDIWETGSLVFRHNTVTNCLWCAHEEGHGGGSLSAEVYNNSFSNTSGQYIDGTRLIHHQGSGELQVFNNSFYTPNTKSEDPISLTDYRSCPADQTATGLLTECDGTQAIDGNRSPTGTYYGYPCWRQLGRMGAGSKESTGQPGALSPVYLWNNYWSDALTKIDPVVENPWSCVGPPTPSTHIMENRDYYTAVSANAQTSPTIPFDGTTGMGFGTIANRPATCSTNSLESGGGVGYFATDVGSQGTLYRCSATNTWTIQYTPYCYPHPLVSGNNCQTPTAISEPKNSGQLIKMYPNPVWDKLYFDRSSSISQLFVSIYTINGKLIAKKMLDFQSDRSIDVSDFSPGLYFVQMVNGDFSTNQKIIIAR